MKEALVSIGEGIAVGIGIARVGAKVELLARSQAVTIGVGTSVWLPNDQPVQRFVIVGNAVRIGVGGDLKGYFIGPRQASRSGGHQPERMESRGECFFEAGAGTQKLGALEPL